MPYVTRKFHTRFVERPLSERPIEPLCRGVQDEGSQRILTISDDGMALLAALVGGSIPQTILPMIAPSLQDVLDGNGGYDSGHGGMLTGAYGEMLGPLVTCLERSGDFEIIRLLWSTREKRPDVLIVDKRSGHAIVQECKAAHCSVDQQDLSVDVCGAIKTHRRRGAKQLDWPSSDALSSHGVSVAPVSDDLTRLLACNERSVVVTAIPDGGIRRFRRSIQSPERAACPQSCADRCLYHPEPSIIMALFAERMEGSSEPRALKQFLGNYKATERAAWGGAHGCFSSLYSDMLSSFSILGRQQESNAEWASLSSLLTGPLDYAVQKGLYVDFRHVGRACSEYLPGPLREPVLDDMHRLAAVQGETERPAVRESSARGLHAAVSGVDSDSPPVGSWRFESQSPETGGPRDATIVEATITKTGGDQLEIVLVPTVPANENTASDMQWALAGIAGGEFAREAYNAFEDESVGYSGCESGERREFTLGRVLHMPWGGWAGSRQQLRRMHGCCPYCADLAHVMEAFWHDPFWHVHRSWHHGHQHHWPWDSSGPTAYVTSDGRGILRAPDWGRTR